jgi:rhamnogalacturonan endolyase
MVPVLPQNGLSQTPEKIRKELLFSDDFQKWNNDWTAEFEDSASSAVRIENGTLDISASAGATVWFKNKLSGNIMITYDAVVAANGGPNDRVSDLNAFWMATDPKKQGMISRNGKFSSYDNLDLYYSGIGGHDNETTRFRKYFSDGKKPVITEYLDSAHLLNGNVQYHIVIIVLEGRIQQYVNGVLFFDFSDQDPYREGYFGFRTTRSHQIMDNFTVYRISAQ